MGGLRALILIFLQAPEAVFRGQFHVDEKYTVYGWPARIVGVLLLFIAGSVVADIFLVGRLRQKGFLDQYLLIRVFSFLGSVIAAAIICVVFRRKRYPVPPPNEVASGTGTSIESEHTGEPEPDGRRGRTGGWRDW